MNIYRVPTLVSAKWLNNTLSNDSISSTAKFRILDATLHLPRMNRNAAEEYQKQHIKGALFFDINRCSDLTSKYQRMLPSEEQFADYVGNLGVTNQTHVIVYDNTDNFGFFSAPRVWWMFRTFGHRLVSVLNGGLLKWIREGFDLTGEIPLVEPTQFKAVINQSAVKKFNDIYYNILDKRFQVMDARSQKSFDGLKPGTLWDKQGHIPGSLNIPYRNLPNEVTGELKSVNELTELFQQKGVDLNKPLVATCGTARTVMYPSGVTACSLVLAAYLCGKTDVPLFDGSWNEYSDRAKPENIYGIKEE
ncbi:thiosulfate sulfurtransferase-like [Glandiceps talaboti]